MMVSFRRIERFHGKQDDIDIYCRLHVKPYQVMNCCSVLLYSMLWNTFLKLSMVDAWNQQTFLAFDFFLLSLSFSPCIGARRINPFSLAHKTLLWLERGEMRERWHENCTSFTRQKGGGSPLFKCHWMPPLLHAPGGGVGQDFFCRAPTHLSLTLTG